MGLLDFIKTGPIKMTQENQKMLFVEFCENSEEYMLPTQDFNGKFSCNVNVSDDKVDIELLIEDKSYSFDIDKNDDGYKFLKNFLAAISYLDDFKEAFFVSHTASPVAEISVLLDKLNFVSFSLLLKKSMVLKQELVNIKIPRDVFENEFVAKFKDLK